MFHVKQKDLFFGPLNQIQRDKPFDPSIAAVAATRLAAAAAAEALATVATATAAPAAAMFQPSVEQQCPPSAHGSCWEAPAAGQPSGDSFVPVVLSIAAVAASAAAAAFAAAAFTAADLHTAASCAVAATVAAR